MLTRTQPPTNPLILIPIPQLRPEIPTPRMPLKRLRPRRPSTQPPQLRRRLVVRHLLVRRRPQILTHPQPSRILSSFARRKNVVRPDALIPVTDARALAEEDGAVVGHLGEGVAGRLGEDLNVLGGILIGEAVGFVHVRHDSDFAVVAPGGPREFVGREVRQHFVDDFDGFTAEGFRVGDEDRRRVGPVLGLGEKVDGDGVGIRVGVCDDQYLRGPREEIDADFAEELAFGLSDEFVARAREEVDFFDGFGAEGHGGDGLHAAEEVDLVGTREVHGGDGGVGNFAGDRGCAGDDVPDARDFGGEDRHVGGGEERVEAAGDVAGGCVSAML